MASPYVPTAVDGARVAALLQNNARIREVIGRRVTELADVLKKEDDRGDGDLVSKVHGISLSEGELSIPLYSTMVQNIRDSTLFAWVPVRNLCYAIEMLIGQYEDNEKVADQIKRGLQ